MPGRAPTIAPNISCGTLTSRVATITLNRPERKNPLTFESYAELRDLFRRLSYADDCRAIVVTGAGGNFCSGGDVHDIIAPLTKMTMPELMRFTRMTGDLVKAMRACPQPIVAAVEGVCAGAGAIVAMASDIRYASANAKTAFLFTRVGLAGCDMGACAILPRIIGHGRASELLYTGRSMSAEEGAAWGFFNRITEAPLTEAQSVRQRSRQRPRLRPLHDQEPAQHGMEHEPRAGARSRSASASHLHEDEGLRTRLRRFRVEAKAGVRGRLMADKSYLNWPFFETRHRELAASLDAWLNETPFPHHVDENGVDDACTGFLKKMVEGGFVKHAVRRGKEQLDVRNLCLIREHFARRSGLLDFVFAMQGLGSGPISLFGSEVQRAHYLGDVAAGERVAAFALSEPEAGSDAAALTLTAATDGDHYVLDGEKTWISNGGIASFYVVFARTGEAAGAKGVSAIIVDADTPGLTVAERIPLIAAHPLARLKFENVRVPRENLIGKSGDGFKIAMATLDVFRSTVGAAALGMARRALDETLIRAKMRRINGAPMAELQMVQAMIADMALKIDAAALLVYRAAWAKDSGAARVTREAAMAKLYATDTAQEVIDAAVQLHGGWGVVHGHPIECLYRDVRALRIYEGASEVQKVIIARQTLAQETT